MKSLFQKESAIIYFLEPIVEVMYREHLKVSSIQFTACIGLGIRGLLMSNWRVKELLEKVFRGISAVIHPQMHVHHGLI